LNPRGGDVGAPGAAASVVEEITGAGGLVATDAWWVGQNGPTGLYLTDEAVDWIDEVANGETPERRGDS
jgi:hypothetical protein